MESAIEGVFVGAAVALLGAPWQLVLGFGAVQLAYNGLRHSQWQRDWGWFGRWVLHPPAAHRLHHSDQPAHYGKNLAFMLPIWDHLFGTWRDHRGESVRLGVPGSTLGEQGWWHGVWSCYRDFWRSLVKPAQAAVAP